MTTRSPWMKKAQAINKGKGSAPATFIEANLEDLKGRAITARVYKDNWGGNSDMMKSSMDAIIDQVADSPDLDQRDIANDQSKGFYAAGTTTDVNPSKQRPKKADGMSPKGGRRTFHR